MTVGELIAELAKHPADATVEVYREYYDTWDSADSVTFEPAEPERVLSGLRIPAEPDRVRIR